MSSGEYYRKDGVRITHDPYAPGMAEKYGAPGATDNEGFDPYADSVGPGIYGGIVKRDTETGEVVIGKQYQNHNRRPGPLYAGGGYAPIAAALHNNDELLRLLKKFPDLANDVTTGGAYPLHMAGMGRENQMNTLALIQHGADLEALDTYGMTALHRMASNNLAVGAKALLDAGAELENRGGIGETPLDIARASQARDVIAVLTDARYKQQKSSVSNVTSIQVLNVDALPEVEGAYLRRSTAQHGVPAAFAKVCIDAGWNPQQTWNKLAGGAGKVKDPVYFQRVEGSNPGSFIYYNYSDNMWWIDATDGLGAFTQKGRPEHVPGTGWRPMRWDAGRMCKIPSLTRSPTVLVFREAPPQRN